MGGEERNKISKRPRRAAGGCPISVPDGFRLAAGISRSSSAVLPAVGYWSDLSPLAHRIVAHPPTKDPPGIIAIGEEEHDQTEEKQTRRNPGGE